MKRANRVLQIEMRKRDVSGRLVAAVAASKKPLATIMKYPAISMTVSAMIAGIIARRALARPLPATLKLLAIPLARRLIHQAIVSSQKNIR